MPSVLDAVRGVRRRRGARHHRAPARGRPAHHRRRRARDRRAAAATVGTVEYNIEGDPRPELLDARARGRPTQCTLVPVLPGELTSQAGWPADDAARRWPRVVGELRAAGIRVSLFVDPDEAAVRWAADVGADRVELYTEPFARAFEQRRGGGTRLVRRLRAGGRLAHALGLGVNAGHDLDLDNLVLFRTLPHLDEVSIGHALVEPRAVRRSRRQRPRVPGRAGWLTYRDAPELAARRPGHDERVLASVVSRGGRVGGRLLAASAARADTRTVTFRTQDGRTVSAVLNEADARPAPAVVLVPMLGRTKDDWQAAGGAARRGRHHHAGHRPAGIRGAGDRPVPWPAGTRTSSRRWHAWARGPRFARRRSASPARRSGPTWPRSPPRRTPGSGRSRWSRRRSTTGACASRTRCGSTAPGRHFSPPASGIRTPAARSGSWRRTPPGIREVHWSDTPAHGTALLAQDPETVRRAGRVVSADAGMK